MNHETIIKSDIKLENFPDNLCMNLATWTSIDNTSLYPIPEYFENIHFSIEKFDQYSNTYKENESVKDSTMTYLINGLFSFTLFCVTFEANFVYIFRISNYRLFESIIKHFKK